MAARFEPKVVRQEIGPMSADLTASATNAAAVITLPAVPNACHAITEGIAYSYGSSGSLTNGRITVAFGGVTDFVIDISAKGNGYVPYRKAAPVNTAVTVTIADGGASVDGKINILGYERMLPGFGQGLGGELDFRDYADSGSVILF
jgi:hypothetical protein